MMDVGHNSRGYLGFTLFLAGLLLFLAFRGVNWQEMLEAAQKARLEYLGAGCLIGSAAFFVRGLRWRVLLGDEKPMAALTVFWANMVGYLGNSYLPARAGELIRSAVLGHRCSVSKSFVLATALTERIMDVIALALIGLVAAMLLGGLSGWLLTAVEVMGIVGLVGVVGLLVTPRLEALLRRVLIILPLPDTLRARVMSMMKQFLLGTRSFQHPGRVLRFAFLTMVIWLTDALGLMIAARALNVPPLGLLQALLLLVALGLSSTIPSTPGYVGIYQLVAVAILPSFGFSRSQALTYIIVLQALYYAVVTTWGLLGLWQLSPSKEVIT